MNPFEDLCNERIKIRAVGGSLSALYHATYSKSKFTVFDGNVQVTEQDVVVRYLAADKTEYYDIVEVQFSPSFHDIPAHVDIVVRKQGLPPPQSASRTTHITISNSQGFQVGDHNRQNIADAFKQVVDQIDRSNASIEQKVEAKGRLKAFLEHPLTSSVVGAAIASMLSPR